MNRIPKLCAAILAFPAQVAAQHVGLRRVEISPLGPLRNRSCQGSEVGDRSRIREALSKLRLILVGVALASCGGEPTALPPPPPPPNRAPLTVGTVPAVEVAAGETATVQVSGFFSDPDGDALAYTAGSSNVGVAAASVTGNTVTVVGVSAGSATVTVTATDGGGLSAQQGFAVTVPNRAPATVGTLPALEIAVSEALSVDVSGAFSDPDGDALTYSASSSDVTVATASTSGTVVTVTAAAQGRAVVTVTATDGGGLSAEQSFAVTVPNRAPAAVGALPGLELIVGEARTVDISGAFTDPDGDALSYTATSSRTRVASAAVTGTVVTVTAVSAGEAVVTAIATDAGGLSATQTLAVSVREPVPVRITGVVPPVLVEGESVTIRGQGFSSSPSENEVLVGGLPATVTSADGTRLVIEVPYADCLPPRTAALAVTAFGRSDEISVGVTPAREEDLALPPGWYRYSTAGYGCLHLPRSGTGGEYLIGVVSTSEVPSVLTRVTMNSLVGDPSVAADGRGRMAGLLAASQALVRAELGGLSARPQGLPSGLAQEVLDPLRDRRRHDEIMERNRSLVRRLGRPDWPARTMDARANVNYTRGDTVTLYAEFGGTCQQSGQVRAVVRLVGDSGVWLDDLANPSGTFTDAELTGFEAFLTRHARPVHDAYFGRLSDVDANERVLILMTREVNRIDKLGGWVGFADLFPASQCATSNEAEITYLVVPDPAGTVGQALTKQYLLDRYPLLLTHEITHLVQGGAQVLGPAGTKTKWENEGGASLAEQLVAYRLFGHGSNRNLGYEEFQTGRFWYSRAWVYDMAAFFGWDSSSDGGRIAGAPEECTWIGLPYEGNDGPCTRNLAYGVSSMVLRYAMDRWGGDYPGGEAALMRRLTQSPHSGFASLQDVSDWRPEKVLADFYLTLWVDLNGGESDGMTSWDLADIWSRFRESTQLLPGTSSHPAFEGSWSVRAGSSFYLHWTPRGGMAPTSLKVIAAEGRVPDHISVWALRIR